MCNKSIVQGYRSALRTDNEGEYWGGYYAIITLAKPADGVAFLTS